MDELLKSIWDEFSSRFGQATDIDIHIDCGGITVSVEHKANTQFESIPDHKIDGTYALLVDE